MLKHLSSVYEYRDWLTLQKENLSLDSLQRLSQKKFKIALHKLSKLEPELASDILLPLYSHTGRPAIDPAVLIRSFILMQHLGYVSPDNWAVDVKNDKLLQYLIGTWSPPSAASYYDFIIRLTHRDPHLTDLYDKDHYDKPPKEKPKKGDKLINYSHTDTYYLLDKYKENADCDSDRLMYTLQSLFNALAVIPSIDTGFIDKQNLILSGDGSALHIHASRFGHQVPTTDPGKPDYRFSAPDADVGWDSDLGEYYLGYTFYNIACHNPRKNIDLPVYISLEKASQHDALTTISASAQLLDMIPDLHPKYMCFDSASDSLPIYQYFQLKNIIPVIDHNPVHNPKKESVKLEHLNGDGIPVCQAGEKMYYYGYDIQRCRKKYRCPLAMGRIDHCPFQDECSTSSYGRVIYVNDGDSARNTGPLSYRSDEWVRIYKNRTSTERINDRVLNDYGLQHTYVRNKAKHAFLAIFAAINIHLDAWVKGED